MIPETLDLLTQSFEKTAAPRALFWLLAPLLVATAVWDLRHMRIPNVLVLLFLALFALVVAPTLPFNDVAWRLAVAACVLALGIAVFAAGLFGGGDAKLLAALMLFVPDGGHLLFVFVLGVSLLLSILTLNILRRVLKAKGSGWRFLHDTRRLPMGVAFATAGLVFWGVTLG